MKDTPENSFTLYMKPEEWKDLYDRCFAMNKVRYAEPRYFIVRVQFGTLYIFKQP
jgi:hypothetical protein